MMKVRKIETTQKKKKKNLLNKRVYCNMASLALVIKKIKTNKYTKACKKILKE